MATKSLNLPLKPFRQTHRKTNTRILADSVRRVTAILLRPLFVAGVVVADLAAPVGRGGGNVDNARRGREGGVDLGEEEEVPEMVRPELRLEAVGGAREGEGLGDCCVVDHHLQ